MSSRRFSSAGRFALWCWAACCCILMAGVSLAETAVQIAAEEEWTWEAGSVASFQGVITPDQDLSGAEISVTVATRLEESGEVQFTRMNGKRLKVKDRSDTVSVDLSAGEECPFEGEWYVPEDVDGGIAHAVLTLRVKDSGGNEIATGTLEMGDQEGESAAIGMSPVKRADQLILILAITCAAVWLLAIVRHVVLNRRKA